MPTDIPREVSTLDSLFDVLSTRESRRLLYYLREHDSATTTELVDALTGWAATDDGPATPDTWSQIQIRLHHVILPQLQTRSLIDYDPDTDTVTLAELPPWIDNCLDTAFEIENEMRTDQELVSVLGEQ